MKFFTLVNFVTLALSASAARLTVVVGHDCYENGYSGKMKFTVARYIFPWFDCS
jgi:hypothetical protein